MATISSATLAITSNPTTKTSRCVVTCKVSFTAFEMNQIKDGLKFSLNCALWGEDLGINNWLDADDFIFSYASKSSPTPRRPHLRSRHSTSHWAPTSWTRTGAPTRSMAS